MKALIGSIETSRLPRPIKVELKGDSTKKCYNICVNSKKLKSNEQYKKVFVKRDEHPYFRKEHARLYKLVSDERKQPDNQGVTIVYDRKAGLVKRDDVVIDRFSPHFQ